VATEGLPFTRPAPSGRRATLRLVRNKVDKTGIVSLEYASETTAD
jgi:hypothetical protein